MGQIRINRITLNIFAQKVKIFCKVVSYKEKVYSLQQSKDFVEDETMLKIFCAENRAPQHSNYLLT